HRRAGADHRHGVRAEQRGRREAADGLGVKEVHGAPQHTRIVVARHQRAVALPNCQRRRCMGTGTAPSPGGQGARPGWQTCGADIGGADMADTSRWDPEMLQFQREAEEYAKNFPPVLVAIPLDPHREVNDLLALRMATGGPVMAATTDRWVAARGRRILCRVHRPRIDRKLPVLMYFHGGG